MAAVCSIANLRTAIRAGRHHIELQQHLHLKDMPITASPFPSQKPVYEPEEDTKSVQVPIRTPVVRTPSDTATNQ